LHKPKPLVPVAKTPMIDFALVQLQKAGIKKVIVAVKYLGEQIRAYLKDNEKFSDLEIIIPDINPIGTADAVRQSADHIDGDFVVSMADVVSDINIGKMVEFFKKTDAYATISLKNIDFPTKKFGVIMLDAEQNIEIFLEKPRASDLLFTSLAFAYRPVKAFHHNLVNTGFYVFKHKVLDILEKYSDIIDFGKHVFPYLLHERFKLNGFVGDYYWMDCGNVQSYLWANWDVLRGFIPSFKPPGQFKDNSWFGNNVSLGAGVKIISPVLIGENVQIGDNCIIGPNTIMHDGCIIENNCSISNSVLWDEVFVGHHSTLDTAVMCEKSALTAYSELSSYTAVPKNEKVQRTVL
ncbi:MAG: sugar phosphate nucleotidyltransferase, partial [Candidatus Heimdallarchaeaceae archaeon]